MLVLTAAVAPAVAATTAQTGERPSFVVTLDENGNAEFALTLTYNLTTDSEQAAFEELRDNETARAALRERFRNRMAAVAADAENATGREMSVENVRVDLSTTNGGETGVVVLRVTYVGLAATDGDALVVTEPFASGFEPDRQFVVRGPDGYAVERATPEPAATGDGSVQYAAGTSLDGFRVTFAPATSTPTATGAPDGGDGGDATTSNGQPGFGAVAVLVALAVVLVALATTRSS